MIPLHWFQANKTNKELPNRTHDSNTHGADFEVAGGNQGSSPVWCGSSTKLETGKTLAKGGNGYWNSIGLGFKTPCEAIEGLLLRSSSSSVPRLTPPESKIRGKFSNKHLFFLIATFYWATVSLHAWAVTDELEVQALQGLYRSLNSPTQLEHWKLEGADPCREAWIGVQCSGSPIINLKLHGLGLAGNLGVELSNLKSLKHLDLSANNIEGSFPYSLPPNLTNLNLGHNFLTGPLDDVLNGLENLKLMDLSFNSFTGELPTSFGSLTNLTGL
ncbi:hypothetical protein OROHE_006874 [Orobanche hederae]